MAQWQKPAEGSWTEHYPGLGTGRVVFDVTPEFYELERDAIFRRAWLNVGRIDDLPRKGTFFTKDLHAARTALLVDVGARTVEAVAPPVVLAHELPADAGGIVAW